MLRSVPMSDPLHDELPELDWDTPIYDSVVTDWLKTHVAGPQQAPLELSWSGALESDA